jgi:hypothetical protein
LREAFGGKDTEWTSKIMQEPIKVTSSALSPAPFLQISAEPSVQYLQASLIVDDESPFAILRAYTSGVIQAFVDCTNRTTPWECGLAVFGQQRGSGLTLQPKASYVVTWTDSKDGSDSPLKYNIISAGKEIAKTELPEVLTQIYPYTQKGEPIPNFGGNLIGRIYFQAGPTAGVFNITVRTSHAFICIDVIKENGEVRAEGFATPVNVDSSYKITDDIGFYYFAHSGPFGMVAVYNKRNNGYYSIAFPMTVSWNRGTYEPADEDITLTENMHHNNMLPLDKITIMQTSVLKFAINTPTAASIKDSYMVVPVALENTIDNSNEATSNVGFIQDIYNKLRYMWNKLTELTEKLDEQEHPQETIYSIRVEGGTANKYTAVKGEAIAIAATTTEANMAKVFDKWVVTPGVEFTNGTNENSPVALFNMPAENVTATAVFKENYTVTVNNGTTDKPIAYPGDVVTITAEV